MKKLNIMVWMMLGALGLCSCESDRDSNPVLLDPTTFTLNTPAYASTVYDLKHSKTLEFCLLSTRLWLYSIYRLHGSGIFDRRV